MDFQRYNNGVFTLQPFFSPSCCEAMIAQAETMGFEAAAINTREGPRRVEDVRNNDRVIFDDHDLAADLFSTLQPHLMTVMGSRVLVGLNERFRFYRYTPGQKFDWHEDGPYVRANNERSLLTLLIYLNDGYGGGETKFEWMDIKGQCGMALVFHHGLVHCGAAVTEGVKYVLRTDVMYGALGSAYY
ncbi:2OG-Fe(II) oxygenase [Chitinivorax sp. B]|uniref:prolyl hydroxylase family protein n=1 Tax=Chitinivorax sp. B TaxID=2502235 RepID=UPI0010F6EE8A|nr:2OG-Fe(II) oxygenase [Chitinivorax sp. B]